MRYVLLFTGLIAFGQEYKDVVYAEVVGRKLLVDVYLPQSNPNPYLVVWVHGGAWHSGSKENPPKGLLENGYAIASVDYRLSIEAAFPAMIHDIKAAIRYLQANAKQYGYNADKIIIAGSSAGGHLAALIGTVNGNTELEGTLGNHLNTSSDVQATVDLYGPTNFLTILNQSTPHGISVRAPALALLLGRPVDQVPELAKLASPVYQVDATDPPMFIAHGDQDNQVPINQAHELHAALKKAGVTVHFEVIHGAGHGSPDYYQPEFTQKIVAFLKQVLTN
ncbi:MAG: lipase [Flavobacteriaceae bacterium]|nr:MAG: lipase [Flavobacteriaceae bacterium]